MSATGAAAATTRGGDGRRLLSRASLFGVAVVLGVLTIGQLRGQAGVPGLSNLSATELTQLIANVTTGNDDLREQVAELQAQEANLVDTKQRGQTTVGDLSDDLATIRAWSGATAVHGQGVVVNVQGPIDGEGVEELINELRNAGAEAIAVAGVRVVAGVVVAGPPGGLSVENQAIGDVFEIRAIGSPQILTGTLTRNGGVIAQIAAAYPGARISVVPIDSISLPASERTAAPTYAEPRL